MEVFVSIGPLQFAIYAAESYDKILCVELLMAREGVGLSKSRLFK